MWGVMFAWVDKCVCVQEVYGGVHCIRMRVRLQHNIVYDPPGMVMTRKGIRMILAGELGFCAPTASL